jgi:hypothetical protein
MRAPRNIAQRLHELDYETRGPCFSIYRMDEARILNEIGALVIFLNLLGIRKSTEELLLNKQARPTWHGYLELEGE